MWPVIDLSPIENVWAYIAKKMAGKCFASKDDVWTEVQKQWNDVPVSFVQSLYHTMPDRLCAVIKAKGGPTRY